MSKQHKVKELKLLKSNIGDEGLSYILKSLENNTTVTNINLSKNYITEKSTDLIINFLKTNKILKSLILTNNGLNYSKEKIKSSSKNNIKITF